MAITRGGGWGLIVCLFYASFATCSSEFGLGSLPTSLELTRKMPSWIQRVCILLANCTVDHLPLSLSLQFNSTQIIVV
ncbi:Os04g0442700, partial [Oryza sativa Japonica Group]